MIGFQEIRALALLRHGYADRSVGENASLKPYAKEELKLLAPVIANAFARSGVPLNRIALFSGEVTRVRQTAEIIEQMLGLTAIVTSFLNVTGRNGDQHATTNSIVYNLNELLVGNQPLGILVVTHGPLIEKLGTALYSKASYNAGADYGQAVFFNELGKVTILTPTQA